MRAKTSLHATTIRLAEIFDAEPGRYLAFTLLRDRGGGDKFVTTKALRELVDLRVVTRKFRIVGSRAFSFYRRGNRPALPAVEAAVKPRRDDNALPRYSTPGGYERRYEQMGRPGFYAAENARWEARVRALAPALDYADACLRPRLPLDETAIIG